MELKKPLPTLLMAHCVCVYIYIAHWVHKPNTSPSSFLARGILQKKGLHGNWQDESQAWFEAQLVSSNGLLTSGGGVAEGIVCVVGAQPKSIALLPGQPGGETDDAHGVPPVPHVRDVVGGGSEVPQVQEHGFARDFLIIKTVTTKTTEFIDRV